MILAMSDNGRSALTTFIKSKSEKECYRSSSFQIILLGPKRSIPPSPP